MTLQFSHALIMTDALGWRIIFAKLTWIQLTRDRVHRQGIVIAASCSMIIKAITESLVKSPNQDEQKHHVRKHLKARTKKRSELGTHERSEARAREILSVKHPRFSAGQSW